MKEMLKYFTAFMILILLVASLAIAVTNFSDRRPSSYTTLTSTSVNFSVTFNQSDSGNSETHWLLTLYNSTNRSSDRNWTQLFQANISNNTMWNVTLVMDNKVRHWWYVNVSNITGGAVISDIRIFEVDTKFLNFGIGPFGAINITLNTGDINTSGKIFAKQNITFIAPDDTFWSCGVQNNGGFNCTQH